MKLSADAVKYKKEKVKGKITIREQDHEVDLDDAIVQIDSIVKQINSLYQGTRDAVNSNETAFNIIREDTGIATDYLPGGAGAGNAEGEYQGQFYVFSTPGSVDELWWCQKTATETYTWVQVTIP